MNIQLVLSLRSTIQGWMKYIIYINPNIDKINRMGQDDLQLERKLHTKDWSIKVNYLILGTDYVDTYYLGMKLPLQLEIILPRTVDLINI